MFRLSSHVFVIIVTLFAFAALAISVNWNFTAEAESTSAMVTVPVSVPNVTAPQGTIVTVPITAGNLTGLNVISYDLHIRYDPTVIQPAAIPFDRAGTLSSDFAVVPGVYPSGHLVIGAFATGPMPLMGEGTLLNLRFMVVGMTGNSTELKFEDWTLPVNQVFRPAFMWNEGNPVAATSNGSVTVGGNTPTASPTPTSTNQATPTASPLVPVPVSLPEVSAAPGSVISIPVNIGDVTGLGVEYYGLQVSFDPTVIQPASPAFDVAETVGSRMFPLSGSHDPGHLFVEAFQPQPYVAGSGVLVYLRFNVVGTLGQSTALVLEDWLAPGHPPHETHPGFMFNEGQPSTYVAANGMVTVGDSVISGTVTYANTNSGPSRLISNAIVSGVGFQTGCSTITHVLDGSYLLSGFCPGEYTVSPIKTGGENGAITSYDAAKVAQHVAGNITLGPLQKHIANVSGDSTLTSFDAAMIAKFVAGPPYGSSGIGSTAAWRFLPTQRLYPSTTGIVVNEDYGAVLMGEVSGNWTNTGARPASPSSIARSIGVTVPRLAVSQEKELIVPVTVEGAAKKNVISYEFDLRYDPSVIQPQIDPVSIAETVSRGLSVVTNVIEPGLLRVVVYGAMPISDDGVLLNLRFTAVGKAGSVSPISFEQIMFNEGEPQVKTTDGQVELF